MIMQGYQHFVKCVVMEDTWHIYDNGSENMINVQQDVVVDVYNTKYLRMAIDNNN